MGGKESLGGFSEHAVSENAGNSPEPAKKAGIAALQAGRGATTRLLSWPCFDERYRIGPRRAPVPSSGLASTVTVLSFP